MKIESSIMSLSASSSQKMIHSSSEQLKSWVDSKSQSLNEGSLKDFIDNQLLGVKTTTVEKTNEISVDISQEDEDKITLLTKLLEYRTGKKIKFYIPNRFLRNNIQNPMVYKNPMVSVQTTMPQKHGWGIDYQKHEHTEETASMHFETKGIVKTSDGKTINIDLSLNLSRSFISDQHTSFKAGDALKDPLVVNFGRASTELTSTKFSFDIDSDGQKDNISFVKSGSGFLAFDKNKDGKINNGSELFGPETGSGFMELKAYDDDNNGWIDENDAIYEQLQIWTKDDQGQDQLFALGQKGIGAIYLNAVASPFELKDSVNSMNGVIQQSSVFLRENGSAGTIQHVDLSV